jgi:hypothetical protein
MLRLIGLGAMALLLAGLLRAQSTNASLTGRITDSSKAVVPNAKVITINTGTRVHYGTYRIEVEKLGFKVVIKSGPGSSCSGCPGNSF